MRSLDNFEKLILMLGASAHPKSSEKYDIDPDFISEVVARGDEWALQWRYDWLQEEAHDKDDIVKEVCDIFDMYRNLQCTIRASSEPTSKSEFPGFDGNNDPHFNVAKTLVDLLDRYTDLSGVRNNSHTTTTIGSYRTMLDIYKSTIGENYRKLTLEEALAIIDA